MGPKKRTAITVEMTPELKSRVDDLAQWSREPTATKIRNALEEWCDTAENSFIRDADGQLYPDPALEAAILEYVAKTGLPEAGVREIIGDTASPIYRQLARNWEFAFPFVASMVWGWTRNTGAGDLRKCRDEWFVETMTVGEAEVWARARKAALKIAEPIIARKEDCHDRFLHEDDQRYSRVLTERGEVEHVMEGIVYRAFDDAGDELRAFYTGCGYPDVFPTPEEAFGDDAALVVELCHRKYGKPLSRDERRFELFRWGIEHFSSSLGLTSAALHREAHNRDGGKRWWWHLGSMSDGQLDVYYNSVIEGTGHEPSILTCWDDWKKLQAKEA